MRPAVALLLLVLVAACAGTPATVVPRAPDLATVGPADFRLLDFLAGRWVTRPANGETVYHEFRYTGPTSMEVKRFQDAEFRDPVANGTVEVVGGRIVYRSGRHRWTAAELTALGITFDPIEDAPTSFAWLSRGEGRLAIVEVFVQPARPPRLVTELVRVPG
jgi:hypothetical protein